MPSPFPGMDPYLEQLEFFPGLHDRLINQLSDALQEQLPVVYYADIRARIWIEYTSRGTVPDISLLRTAGPSGSQPTNGTEGSVAVRVPAAVVKGTGEERRESFLEIRSVRGDNSLVTAIEILSPTNKTPGAHGQSEYLKKQEEFLHSRVNLVEIDLLRGGRHTTAVPLKDAVKAAGPFDCHVMCPRDGQPGSVPGLPRPAGATLARDSHAPPARRPWSEGGPASHF